VHKIFLTFKAGYLIEIKLRFYCQCFYYYVILYYYYYYFNG